MPTDKERAGFLYEMAAWRPEAFQFALHEGILLTEDNRPLEPWQHEMAREEGKRREIERGHRLPDDATCAICRFWEGRDATCHIRSTEGPFPPRNRRNWCGEWQRRPSNLDTDDDRS